MNNSKLWPTLRARAAKQLQPDLAAAVLAQAAKEKRQRAELVVGSATVSACLLILTFFFALPAYREQQESIQQWQQLVEITQAIDQGL